MEQQAEKIGYKQVFSQKEYCKLIIAGMISRFGDSIDAIAFTWLVYQVTGSAAWSGIIFTLNRLPSIFLQPFAGAAVERMRKKRIVISADLMRGVLVMILAALYLTENVNPFVLAAFTLLISTVEAFEMPAATALVPKVLEAKYYEFGTSLRAVASTVMELLGTGCAGVIIGVFGVWVAILIDAITFFMSALIQLFVKVEETPAPKTEGGWGRKYLTDLKEGVFYLKEKRVVLNFCLLAFFVNAMVVPLNSFQAPLVSDVLGQGSELLSVMGIACVLGTGLGSLIYPYVSKRCSVANFVFVNGIILAFCEGFCVAGSYFVEQTAVVYTISALTLAGMGMAASLLSTEVSVLFMKSVEQEYLAREAALLNAGATAAMPITSFILSALVAVVPLKKMMICCGIVCGIIFLGVRLFKVQFESEDIPLGKEEESGATEPVHTVSDEMV